jgi:alkaline phosphatase D
VSNSQPGPPYGREAEIASILSQLSRRAVRNVVWVTADVHYTAAHHYSPERAVFTEFDPFWEFVSGPLHAGAYGANGLDDTFGPEAVFVHAAPAPNTSPLDGYQHFGEIDIDSSGELTVTLRDQSGSSLWSKRLEPLD